MKRTGYAFFVESPRRIADLIVPHPVGQERPYEIAKTVRLAKIDYENFITDMVADRQYIEEHAGLCSRGDMWKCIFVRQRGRLDGVLVMPVDRCFVGWAAPLPDASRKRPSDLFKTNSR